MQYSESFTIRASRDVIWQTLADIESWPAWTPTVAKVDALDAGGLAVGNRFQLYQPKLPKAVWTVTRLEPNVGFVWESRAPGFLTVGEHWIADVTPEACSVVLKIKQSGLFAAILLPFLSRLTKTYVHMEGEGLRRRVEH
jgi:hypothetical protein